MLLGNLEICNIIRSKSMSEHLPKLSLIQGVGISVAGALIPIIARSQSKSAKTDSTPIKIVGGVALPDPNAINKKIQKDYPAELFDDPNYTQKGAELNSSTTTNPATIPGVAPGVTSGNGNMTSIGTSQYTFVLSTPILIAIMVVVGGLALFPIVQMLLNSKKILAFKKNSTLSKLFDRVQKPKVLESDEFLHQRNLDQLTAITAQAESIHGEKFGNNEFTTFIKIKSYIYRSMDEYAGLDHNIDMLTAAVSAQNSFLTIEGSESRHCSSTQQELYKLVNKLLREEIDPKELVQQANIKLAELLPLLKTEEGKVALQTYVQEIDKVSQNPLGLKLLLLFKQYNFDDFSTLRSVNNTIDKLGNEDLLNLDGLLVLVMVKYDIFEKLGPIIGVTEEHNRPETYAKMLQYVGLKAHHEESYQKFQDFLLLIKKWGTHYQTVINVRQKYNAKEYRLSKSFTATIPGIELYKKYKDILPATGVVAAKPLPVRTVDLPTLVVVTAAEKEVELEADNVLVSMK
jgi:hypothetical protein